MVPVIVQLPLREKRHALVHETKAYSLKNGEQVVFVHKQKPFFTEPSKIPVLLKSAVTDSPRAQSVLFGRMNVHQLALETARNLPHKTRLKLTVPLREHIAVWVSMLMTANPRWYSLRSVELQAAKYFGPNFAKLVAPIIHRWLSEGTVRVCNGHSTGTPLYRYEDRHSGIYSINGFKLKRRA